MTIRVATNLETPTYFSCFTQSFSHPVIPVFPSPLRHFPSSPSPFYIPIFLNSKLGRFQLNMTLKGGTSQACASCKYQRRRCTNECPLAPYFPADQPKMFQNAHKLFGVRNMLNILKDLTPEQKFIAMNSIIYEANIRDKFPVHGCCEIICQLYYQIQQVQEELHSVQTQIQFYRQQQNQQQQISTVTDDMPSPLELGMGPPINGNGGLSLFQNVPNGNYNVVPQSYSNNSSTVYSSAFMDSKDNVVNPLWIQQHPYTLEMNDSTTNNNNNALAIQSQLLVVQQEAVQDYDEMHPFFDAIDDRQSYIDSKEACESSTEFSLKDTTQTIEHVAENELKSAAACFSLTSVN